MFKTIADKEQLQFLLYKLTLVCKDDLKSSRGEISKDSFGKVESYYFNIICKKYPKRKYTSIRDEHFNGESVFKLFQGGFATIKHDYIQHLSLIVLDYDQKLRPHIVENLNKYLSQKKLWEYFLNIYQQELQNSYLFYFWHEDNISIFEMNFLMDRERTKWQGCKINLYEYAEHSGTYEKRPFESVVKLVENLLPAMDLNSAILNVAYNETTEMQLVFSTGHDINGRNLYFGAYSGINLAGEIALGIGLLIREIDTQKKIDEINKTGRPDSSIFNFLFQRRQIIKKELLDKEDVNKLPNADEMHNIKDIAGYWKAFYLRSDKPDIHSWDSKQRGGIEFNLFEVRDNGLVYLYCDRKKGREQYQYKGFLSFPLFNAHNYKLIKANLHLFEDNSIYKLHLFLNKGDNDNIVEGVYTGWNESGKPFSTLIRLERLGDGENSIDELVEKATQRIGFIPKEAIKIDEDISPSLIDFLKNGRTMLDIAGNSLPRNLLSHNFFPASFAGNYYLLSYDFQHGLLDKAKLEIRENGTFSIEYADVFYKGTASKLGQEISGEEYLSLRIEEKRRQHEDGNTKFTNATGDFFFHTGNVINVRADILGDKITVLTGASLRINIEGSLQAKKEFLLPADKRKIFNEEKTMKFNYDDPDFFANIKNNAPDTSIFEMMKERIHSALMGKENNLILVHKKTTNKPLSNFRKSDYGEIYLKAFILDIMAGRHPAPDIYINFIEAVLHGKQRDELILILNRLFKHATPRAINNIRLLLKDAQKNVFDYVKGGSVNDLFKLVSKKDNTEVRIIAVLDDLINEIRNLDIGKAD